MAKKKTKKVVKNKPACTKKVPQKKCTKQKVIGRVAGNKSRDSKVAKLRNISLKAPKKRENKKSWAFWKK